MPNVRSKFGSRSKSTGSECFSVSGTDTDGLKTVYMKKHHSSTAASANALIGRATTIAAVLSFW
jgi:hypothetical protein